MDALRVLLPGTLVQTCVVGLVAGLFAYWILKKYKSNLPPGPMPLPLIGNLHNFKTQFIHDQVFTEWSKQYGSVVSVYFGPTLLVFVNDITTALEVLVKRSSEFANRMIMPSLDVMSNNGRDITFAAYGPTWKLHRQMTSKALRHYMMGKALENRIHTAMETALVEIKKRSKEAFDPNEYITFIVGNIFTGLCFGGKYSFEDKEVQFIGQQVHDLFGMFHMVFMEDAIPPLRYIYKTKRFQKLECLTENVTGFVRERFYEEKKTFDRDNIRHFVDTLLLARLEAEEEEGTAALESLTETHLVETLFDIYVAGTETTRSTLLYAILHMIVYPEIQDKVREEIHTVVGNERMPDISDRPNLCYTEAVLHESMRLASVTPTGVLHASTCDTELAGYQIPKGTLIAINIWALHHDPSVWKDVDQFIPERFLDDDGKMSPKPQNWLPFSAGKRGCLGEFVAKPELHLIFATLMQTFIWKTEPGVVPTLEASGHVSIRAVKPYRVMVEKC